MKETLTTISQRTGVSVTTCSRVLSGQAAKWRIKEETAARVKAEAKKCGYRPKHVKKHLSTENTHSIGLLIPSFRNQYFAEVASVIISEASKKGYSTIVLDTMEDESVLKRGISTLVEKKVEGLIIVPCGTDPMWMEQVDRTLLPVVLIDRYYKGSSLSYAATNNYQGGLNATEHLISNGHRKIVCIQGIPSSMPNQERVNGYCAAMENAGLEGSILVVGDAFTIDNGYNQMKAVLSMRERPSAIFALSSTIMLGVMQAIREHGLTVPDDISVISFDNYVYLDYMQPPITRISQPVDDMGAVAIQILFDKIVGKAPHNTQLRLSSTLVEGKSVARIGVSKG